VFVIAEYSVIIATAMVFVVGHIRPTPISGTVSWSEIMRAFSLNGLAGPVLGALYLKKVIEAAIIAYVCADPAINAGPANLLRQDG
jgi:hypothetical protein